MFSLSKDNQRLNLLAEEMETLKGDMEFLREEHAREQEALKSRVAELTREVEELKAAAASPVEIPAPVQVQNEPDNFGDELCGMFSEIQKQLAGIRAEGEAVLKRLGSVEKSMDENSRTIISSILETRKEIKNKISYTVSRLKT